MLDATLHFLFITTHLKMTKTLRKAIYHLSRKPKALFLVDALGALLTALLLFVVVKHFNTYFGMSETMLGYLSLIAGVLCIYSATCFFFLKENWPPFIRGIAIANILYCLLTLVTILSNCAALTSLGVTYFLVEIAVVCVLVYIELNVAVAIKKNVAGGIKNE